MKMKNDRELLQHSNTFADFKLLLPDCEIETWRGDRSHPSDTPLGSL